MSNILDTIHNWWYNISGQKEQDIKKQQSRNAINFVIDYYNSPGFRERFKNVPYYVKIILQTLDIVNSQIIFQKIIFMEQNQIHLL